MALPAWRLVVLNDIVEMQFPPPLPLGVELSTMLGSAAAAGRSALEMLATSTWPLCSEVNALPETTFLKTSSRYGSRIPLESKRK